MFAVMVLGGISGVVLLFLSFQGGVHLIAVLSGSMKPEWAKGELLFLQAEPATAVRVGQAIAWHPPAKIFNAPVIHQVVSIRHASYGFVAQTKGLANKAPDPWLDVFKGQVYHVVYALPYIGWISIWLNYWRVDVAALTILVSGTLAVIAYRYYRQYRREGQLPLSVPIKPNA